MNIILDAHGGDNAPLEVIKGAAMAVREYGVQVTLCGRQDDILAAAEQSGIPLANLEGIKIAPAAQAMPMDVDPTDIVGNYANSSMAVGLKLLAEGRGDAFVTAGNTGAVVVGASLFVKRLKGIKRAAIATLIPTMERPYLLIDSGANAECRPEMLQQFAIMGSAYMSKVLGVENPRVGLVNIGTEENKGTSLQLEAFKLLQASPINFIGNVEAREIPLGGCDVAVCDGFTGNVILKLTEGMGKLMSSELKKILLKNTGTKLAALMVKGGVDNFRKKMDYTEHGGAPLLGISKPVIKAHGSSNDKAFKNAIRQAKQMVENQMIATIAEGLASLKAQEGEQKNTDE